MLDQRKSNDWDASLFDENTLVKKDHTFINKGLNAYVTDNGFKKQSLQLKVGVFRSNGRTDPCLSFPSQ